MVSLTDDTLSDPTCRASGWSDVPISQTQTDDDYPTLVARSPRRSTDVLWGMLLLGAVLIVVSRRTH